jgi:hypothetical protein
MTVKDLIYEEEVVRRVLNASLSIKLAFYTELSNKLIARYALEML